MSTRFTHIFFDLDGTLTDSAPGILNACQYSLTRLGLSIPRKDLYVFIGPPLLETFTRFTGSPEGGQEGVRLYREYFTEKGIFENSVYPGARDMLAAMQNAGLNNVLATAKPLIYARRILEHFSLTTLFAYVGGADLHGGLHTKGDVLAANLRALDLAPERVLMVGDRRDDVDAAQRLGLCCAAVRYGYSEPGEIDHADYLCDTPADVVRAALGA